MSGIWVPLAWSIIFLTPFPLTSHLNFYDISFAFFSFFYFTLFIPCLLAFASLFVLYLLPFVSFRFILICFLTEPEMEFLKQITVNCYLGPRETLLS